VKVLGDDTNSNTMGGDQNAPADQVEAPAAPETPAPAETSSYGALMQSLEAIGIGKPMESLGFNIHGYVEGGYLYDMTVPKDNGYPAKTQPGDDIYFAGPYKNAPMLNQADLTIERDMVNLPKGSFDVGFKVEAGYGRDDYYTHSAGILDQHNEQIAEGLNTGGLDDELDLLQAYVQVGIPVGNGIVLEAGKFVSLLGYETIDPTQNLLYTHSYGFSYGRPYTMTGALASYVFSDQSSTDKLSITGGVTEGWNQSFRTPTNPNADPDGVIQVKDTNGYFDWTANLMFGPMGLNPYDGSPDYAHWWWVPELIGTWHVSDQFSVTGDFLYGDAPGAAFNGQAAQWFSAACYFKYQLDPHVYLGTRAEFYHDGRGTTTRIGGGDVNYGEAAVGAGVTPFPDSPWLDGLAIRPEVRCDWADHGVFDAVYNSTTGQLSAKFNEVTAAIDVFFRF
jgi:hypothetical protein